MNRAIVLALGLTAATAACAGHGGTTADADNGTYNCATETRADTFVVGLEKKGAQSAVDFKLMTATPSPPVRGDNAWVVQVNQMAGGVVGAPMTGATLTVTPYMPDHQHSTPKDVVVTAMGAGQYKLSPVNMWMPGLWQTTIQVAPAAGGGAGDSAVYSFCIPN